MSPLLPDGPIDTLGVLDAVLRSADRVAEARSRTPTRPVPGDADAVVLVASGPSRPAADAVVALVGDAARVPLVVVDRSVPAWVGDRTLAVVVALGPSRDAAAGARSAREAGATVIGVGTGPEVESLAEADLAVLRVGEDAPAPRFAVPAAIVALLGALAPHAALPDLAGALDAAEAQLHTRTAELAADPSPAARLARRLGHTLTLAYGAGPLGALAARRWKQQVNDNVKAASFANALPDLAHHELSGWGQHGDVTRQVFSLVTLRHDFEHPDDVARFGAVEALVDEVVAARHELRAAGDGPLAQLLDLFLVADMVSYHLAQEHEIDPGPTAVDPEREDLGTRT